MASKKSFLSIFLSDLANILTFKGYSRRRRNTFKKKIR